MPDSSPVPKLRELQSAVDAQIEQLIARIGNVSTSAADGSDARRQLERLRSKLDAVFDEGAAKLES